MAQDLQQARELIFEGKTEEAIDRMKVELAGTRHYDTLTLLNSRFEHLQRQSITGVIDDDDFALERNKINAGLIELIGLVEGEYSPVVRDPAGNPRPRPGNRRWIPLTLTAVAGLIALYFIVALFAPEDAGPPSAPASAGYSPDEQPVSEDISSRTPASPNYELPEELRIGKISGDTDLPLEIISLRRGPEALQLVLRFSKRDRARIITGLKLQNARQADQASSLRDRYLLPPDEPTDLQPVFPGDFSSADAFHLIIQYQMGRNGENRTKKVTFGTYD